MKDELDVLNDLTRKSCILWTISAAKYGHGGCICMLPPILVSCEDSYVPLLLFMCSLVLII